MWSKQELLIETAKKYIDLPYKDLGRSIYGVDCVGYFKLIFNEIEYPFNPPNNYARNMINSKELKDEMKRWFHILPNRTNFMNGDIGMFHEQYHPCHIGVLEIDSSGVSWVLHACRRKQKVIRERMGPVSFSKLISAYRMREM
jgi:hypothetical protein